MLLLIVAIAKGRDDELVLARLTAIYVVCRVEEGSIGDEEGHGEALMKDHEVFVFVDGVYADVLVVVTDDLVLVLKELDELLRHQIVRLYLTNGYR